MSSTIHASSKGLKDLPNASATIGNNVSSTGEILPDSRVLVVRD
jgi:hypothetical protein